MASTLAATTATSPRAADGDGSPAGAALTGPDLLAGAGLLILAVAAEVSLVLAHLGAHSATAVLGLSLLVVAGAVLLGVRAARSRGVRGRGSRSWGCGRDAGDRDDARCEAGFHMIDRTMRVVGRRRRG